MKPSGIIIENHFDTDSEQETNWAGIIMSPDSPDGFFFSPPTGANRVEVRVAVEDAMLFQKTKSEKIKQKILDTYIIPVPGSQKYAFPQGGILGNILVGGVLEVPGGVIKNRSQT